MNSHDEELESTIDDGLHGGRVRVEIRADATREEDFNDLRDAIREVLRE